MSSRRCVERKVAHTSYNQEKGGVVKPTETGNLWSKINSPGTGQLTTAPSQLACQTDADCPGAVNKYCCNGKCQSTSCSGPTPSVPTPVSPIPTPMINCQGDSDCPGQVTKYCCQGKCQATSCYNPMPTPMPNGSSQLKFNSTTPVHLKADSEGHIFAFQGDTFQQLTEDDQGRATIQSDGQCQVWTSTKPATSGQIYFFEGKNNSEDFIIFNNKRVSSPVLAHALVGQECQAVIDAIAQPKQPNGSTQIPARPGFYQRAPGAPGVVSPVQNQTPGVVSPVQNQNPGVVSPVQNQYPNVPVAPVQSSNGQAQSRFQNRNPNTNWFAAQW